MPNRVRWSAEMVDRLCRFPETATHDQVAKALGVSRWAAAGKRNAMRRARRGEAGLTAAQRMAHRYYVPIRVVKRVGLAALEALNDAERGRLLRNTYRTMDKKPVTEEAAARVRRMLELSANITVRQRWEKMVA